MTSLMRSVYTQGLESQPASFVLSESGRRCERLPHQPAASNHAYPGPSLTVVHAPPNYYFHARTRANFPARR